MSALNSTGNTSFLDTFSSVASSLNVSVKNMSVDTLASAATLVTMEESLVVAVIQDTKAPTILPTPLPTPVPSSSSPSTAPTPVPTSGPTSGPTTILPTPVPTSRPTEGESSKYNVLLGLPIEILVGCAAGAICFGVLVGFCCWRYRSKKHLIEHPIEVQVMQDDFEKYSIDLGREIAQSIDL